MTRYIHRHGTRKVPVLNPITGNLEMVEDFESNGPYVNQCQRTDDRRERRRRQMTARQQRKLQRDFRQLCRDAMLWDADPATFTDKEVALHYTDREGTLKCRRSPA